MMSEGHKDRDRHEDHSTNDKEFYRMSNSLVVKPDTDDLIVAARLILESSIDLKYPPRVGSITIKPFQPNDRKIHHALLLWQDRLGRRPSGVCAEYLSRAASRGHLLCEWDPVRDLPAFLHRTLYHGNAEYLIGHGPRRWRVCRGCVRRPALIEAATTPGSASRLKVWRIDNNRLVSDFNGKINV